MKRKLALWRSVLFISLFIQLTIFSFAQNNFTVTGKVTDNVGKPIEGVTVQIKGTAISTMTKTDGTFSINAPSGSSVLVFSSVGFSAKEVPINNKSQVNLSMVNADNSLDNVVVIGYGSRRKGEVTGSVTSISGDNLRSVPTTNLTQALQGRVAGVTVTPNGFRPGTGSAIRVRGNRSLSASNEPLYVVDGFPVSYTIDDINPADIESIDVLKDAAATAIYGVRGANGVIQITTRKGKAGKFSVNYQGSQSVESILREVPVFNGAQLADAWRQAFFADTAYTRNIGKRSGTNPLFYYPDALADLALFKNRFGSDAQWNAIKDAYQWAVYDPATNTYIPRKRATTADEKAVLQSLGFMGSMRTDSIDIYDPSKVKSYDWLNGVGLRKGHTTDHSISVTGGTDKLRASFGAGYLKQEGIEYAQDYTRYSIGSSLEFRPAKFLTFGTSVNYINAVTNTSTSTYVMPLE